MNTVLITGACINTGVAIVEKFASEGWNVVFTGRNPEKVRVAEKACRFYNDFFTLPMLVTTS